MTFLYLNSDQMGGGKDELLGRKLMKNFLENLAASDITIDVVGCVNSGVFLTTDGSDVLDALARLQQRGARIASCCTCLEHWGLTQRLQIGEIGTMQQSVHVMAMADKVIRP